MSKIKVPKEMLAAVYTDKVPCSVKYQDMENYLESAIRLLYDKIGKMERKPYEDAMAHKYNACLADIRRLFLAPEPEIPEAIEYLWWSECETQRKPDENSVSVHARKLHNKQLIEAFRAGQKAGGPSVDIKRVQVDTAIRFEPKPMPEYTFEEIPAEQSIIELMDRRMAEYADWVQRNLYNLFEKTPLEPRLEWDKPGRKVFTYADVKKAGSK